MKHPVRVFFELIPYRIKCLYWDIKLVLKGKLHPWRIFFES